MSVCSFQVAHASSSPIDGGTTDLPAEHTSLIKSIFEIKVNPAKICTASLVDRRILLTAWHCVAQLSLDGRMVINGNSNYQIAGLEKAPSQFSIDAAGTLRNTDLALILFEPRQDAPSFDEVGVLKIASQPVFNALESRVLLAGFGETSMLNQRKLSHQIGAGYNDLPSAETRAQVDQRLVELSAPFPGLPIIGKRVIQQKLVSEKGSMINADRYDTSISFEPNTAVPGTADSGGPLIGFDSKGNAWVVGVASKVHTNLFARNYRFSLQSPSGLNTFFETKGAEAEVDQKDYPVLKKYLAAINHFFAQSWIQLGTWAQERGFMQDDGIVLQSFQMVAQYETIHLGIYAEVSLDLNYSWIQGALTRLKQKRDSK